MLLCAVCKSENFLLFPLHSLFRATRARTLRRREDQSLETQIGIDADLLRLSPFVLDELFSIETKLC